MELVAGSSLPPPILLALGALPPAPRLRGTACGPPTPGAASWLQDAGYKSHVARVSSDVLVTAKMQSESHLRVVTPLSLVTLAAAVNGSFRRCRDFGVTCNLCAWCSENPEKW